MTTHEKDPKRIAAGLKAAQTRRERARLQAQAEANKETTTWLSMQKLLAAKPSGMDVLTRDLLNLALSAEAIVSACAKDFESNESASRLFTKFSRKTLCSVVSRANNFFLSGVDLAKQLDTSSTRPTDAQINLLNNKFEWFNSAQKVVDHFHNRKGIDLDEMWGSVEFMLGSLRGYTPAEDVARFLDGMKQGNKMARLQRSVERKHRGASEEKIARLTEKKLARKIKIEESKAEHKQSIIQDVIDELEVAWERIFESVKTSGSTSGSWDGVHPTYARAIITKAYEAIDETLTMKEDLLFSGRLSRAFETKIELEADTLEATLEEITFVYKTMERLDAEHQNTDGSSDDPHDVDLERSFGVGENPDLLF